MLKAGEKAPDFALAASDGTTVRLSDFSGTAAVVLIFYPGDQTPGCTKQLCAVRDDYAAFTSQNVKVFGVNPAGVDSHEKFVKRYSFPFPLLVDAKGETAKAYGCSKGPFVTRTVYAIDKDGTIVFAKRGMPANSEILEAIRNTQAGT